MKKKFEQTCSQLSQQEREKLVFAKWPKATYQTTTIIPYTFDTNSITKTLRQVLLQYNPEAKTTSLVDYAKTEMQKVLQLWRSACGDFVEFQYKEKLDDSEFGITIIGCELADAHASAMYDICEHSQFRRVLVCVPKNISTPYDTKAYSHEIGHGLGFEHTHEIETIKQRLLIIAGGQGCSVMGYNNILASPDNTCTISEYCGGTTYGIYPGPMDSSICQSLYGYNPFYKSHYFNSIFLGFLNLGFESAAGAFLEKIECLRLDKEWIERISIGSMMVLQWYRADIPQHEKAKI